MALVLCSALLGEFTLYIFSMCLFDFVFALGLANGTLSLRLALNFAGCHQKSNSGEQLSSFAMYGFCALAFGRLCVYMCFHKNTQNICLVSRQGGCSEPQC